MAAYFIVDVDVKNPQAYETYKQGAAASIAQYGGRYLVRGGKHEVLEGDWQPTRLVVLEFPTVAAARRWYASAASLPPAPRAFRPGRDIARRTGQWTRRRLVCRPRTPAGSSHPRRR